MKTAEEWVAEVESRSVPGVVFVGGGGGSPDITAQQSRVAFIRAIQADALETAEAYRIERDELLAAARSAIPEAEHPLDPTTHNWAWQIRTLGSDRRACYRFLAEAREEVRKLKPQ